MRWPGIEGIYGPTLRTTTVFGKEGEKRWEDLHTRVIEHVCVLSLRLHKRSNECFRTSE
jgi:hypothetical protein